MSEQDPRQAKIEELETQIRELQRAAAAAAEGAEVAKLFELERDELRRALEQSEKDNARLRSQLADLTRATSGTDVDTITDLGANSVQLAQSVTIEIDGVRHSARMGDVLTTDKGAVQALAKRARQHRLSVHVVSKATLDEVRKAGLVRGL